MSGRARPLVGLTVSYDDRWQGLHALRREYVRAVDAAGGLPVAPAPLLDAAADPALLDRLDALVLSGGGDVDPELFGQSPHPKLGKVIRERDDKDEVSTLMRLLLKSLKDRLHELNKNNIKLTCIGNIESLPDVVQKQLFKDIERTKNNKRMTLNLALSYSGRWELLEAVKNILKKL